MNSIKFSAVAYSDKGKVRSNNEDNFYFNGVHLTEDNRDNENKLTDVPSKNSLLYGVFDGMGGEALGEEASLITAETIGHYHEKLLSGKNINTDKLIFAAIKKANKRICDKIMEAGEKRIGTTLSVLIIDDDAAKVYNVGDSRVYLFRDDELRQVSVDDTSVQRMVNMGIITKEEAKTHRDRHKLTQHLGIFEDEMVVEPHISSKIELKKGDCFLLCSDGLTDMVSDEKIEEIIKNENSCEAAADKLVQEALNNGGADNVTVVMVSADSAPRKKRRKKHKNSAAVFIMALLLLAAAAFALKMTKEMHKNDSGGPTYIEAETISWTDNNNEKYVGDNGSFGVSVYPKEISGKIEYTSSDSSVVSVNEKGIFKALSEGTVEITARIDNQEIKRTVSVKTKPEEQTADD